jgi:hypothetical protein
VGIIWTIVIGFVAGVIAKLITPGKNHSRYATSAHATGFELASQDVVEIERSAGYAERLITRSIDRAGRE